MIANRPPEFWTTSAVVVRLGVSPTALRRAIETGVVHPVRVGRQFAFRTDDIDTVRQQLLDAGLLAAEAAAPGILIPDQPAA